MDGGKDAEEDKRRLESEYTEPEKADVGMVGWLDDQLVSWMVEWVGGRFRNSIGEQLV